MQEQTIATSNMNIEHCLTKVSQQVCDNYNIKFNNSSQVVSLFRPVFSKSECEIFSCQSLLSAGL